MFKSKNIFLRLGQNVECGEQCIKTVNRYLQDLSRGCPKLALLRDLSTQLFDQLPILLIVLVVYLGSLVDSKVENIHLTELDWAGVAVMIAENPLNLFLL